MTKFEQRYFEQNVAKTYEGLFGEKYPRKIAWNIFACRHSSVCYTFKAENSHRYCVVSCMKCKEELVCAYSFDECRDKLSEMQKTSVFQGIKSLIKRAFS